MPYYGVFGNGEGGTSDHRLLSGRADANQHPASAVAVAPIQVIGADAGTVQQALEALAARGGVEEIAPVAAVAIGAYKAVAFRPDGQIEPADHDNPAHCARIAGVTLASAAAGSAARVAVDGPLRFDGWHWTPGAPVFVGNAGGLAPTPPATGFAQHIGFALASDALLLQIETPVTRS
jgi:hypothetical protein